MTIEAALKKTVDEAVKFADESPFPRRLLDAGASGYLTKGCPAEELIKAIRRVAKTSLCARLYRYDGGADVSFHSGPD